MSGGVSGAAKGTLAVMVSGPRAEAAALAQYPAAKPGLEGWVARLDVEPKT